VQIRASQLAGKCIADRFSVGHEAARQPADSGICNPLELGGGALLTAVPWETRVSSCGVGNGFSINVVMVAG
jgi:hypothetical protein